MVNPTQIVGLVTRFRCSLRACGESVRELLNQSDTRMIDLLVSFRIRSSLAVGAALACICGSEFKPAWAGPAVASTETVAASSASAPGIAVESPPPGRVYLFRGAMGPIFSRGMDRLTDRLESAGLKAEVNEFTICRFIAMALSSPGPVFPA